MFLELLIFSCDGMRILDLFRFKSRKFQFPCTVPLQGLCLIQLFLQDRIGFVGIPQFAEKIGAGLPAVGIQDLTVLLFVEKRLVLVLSVDIDQYTGQFLECRSPDTLPVHLTQAPAVCDLALHHDQAVLVGQIQIF